LFIAEAVVRHHPCCQILVAVTAAQGLALLELALTLVEKLPEVAALELALA
jgi:hypothetical protein